MRSKRLWLWITYYGVAVVAIAVAAIVWRDKINFSCYSAFPIGYIALTILLACYFSSNLRIRILLEIERQNRGVSYGHWDLSPRVEALARSLHHQSGKAYTKIILAYIPFFMAFILFFSATAKIFSALVLLSFMLVILLYHHIHDEQDHAKRQAMREKELKEQEQKEELGKWK